MLLRFCIKMTTASFTRSYYIKANNAKFAITKLIEKTDSPDIKKIELIGDALPAPKTAIELLKESRKKTNKVKRWQAAKKYQLKSGISVFAKPKN